MMRLKLLIGLLFLYLRVEGTWNPALNPIVEIEIKKGMVGRLEYQIPYGGAFRLLCDVDMIFFTVTGESYDFCSIEARSDLVDTAYLQCKKEVKSEVEWIAPVEPAFLNDVRKRQNSLFKGYEVNKTYYFISLSPGWGERELAARIYNVTTNPQWPDHLTEQGANCRGGANFRVKVVPPKATCNRDCCPSNADNVCFPNLFTWFASDPEQFSCTRFQRYPGFGSKCETQGRTGTCDSQARCIPDPTTIPPPTTTTAPTTGNLTAANSTGSSNRTMAAPLVYGLVAFAGVAMLVFLTLAIIHKARKAREAKTNSAVSALYSNPAFVPDLTAVATPAPKTAFAEGTSSEA
eukprot:TRINITY_DN8415_c0_g1_i1.p1 TRINITY_DN8415_c0_g1~~TRINITY_DN8415_c0_g1_i1.p1  ORF type:complete len:348 (+),score=40.74 TRINITY_DN8415_c0_g1_i1:3-1046(+)